MQPHTNEVIEMLLHRKSVRAFEKREITPETKDIILASAMRAPTAGNSMLYSIIDVTDQEIKDKLAISCDNQPFIAKAPMVLIFCADYRRWMLKFEQAGCDDLHAPTLSDLILSTNDAVIAAHTAAMTAESLDVGSCYIGDIMEQWETHQEIFGLPAYVAPVSMLVFGYPTEQQKNRKLTERFPKEMIVFENKYRDLTSAELHSFKSDEDATSYCNRKYTSSFAFEMIRSFEEIFKNWKGE